MLKEARKLEAYALDEEEHGEQRAKNRQEEYGPGGYWEATGNAIIGRDAAAQWREMMMQEFGTTLYPRGLQLQKAREYRENAKQLRAYAKSLYSDDHFYRKDETK